MSIETDIKEFREAFNLPVNEKPGMISAEDFRLHLSLIEEEVEELVVAFKNQDVTEIFDAVIDIIYVTAGLGVQAGFPLSEGWREVHSSNMSKLDENGEPIYHDGLTGPEGKVKKSENFWEPRLDILLEMMGKEVEWLEK